MPPGRAESIRKIESGLLGTFRKWGYQEIRTPVMEYLETMQSGLEESELDIAFKFVDRTTGKMMVLRSDVTPQVARMAAIALQDAPRPLRLCYVTNVFRYSDDPSFPRREVIQAGAELVGLDDPRADAEVVSVAIAALNEMGLSNLRISLGHVQYTRGLLDQCDLSREAEDLLLEAAIRKDGVQLLHILEQAGVSANIIEAMMSLVDLSGGTDILEKARKLAPGEECLQAIENLETILGFLKSYGVDMDQVQVDLGELEAFRYHTGIVFSAYAVGAGKPVLKGGRYDNLVGRFGNPDPSTGFAIDILEVAEIVAGCGEHDYAISYLVVNRTEDIEAGLLLSMDLRNKGQDVLCLIRDMTDSELRDYAVSNRIETVLVIADEGDLFKLDRAKGALIPCKFEEL